MLTRSKKIIIGWILLFVSLTSSLGLLLPLTMTQSSVVASLKAQEEQADLIAKHIADLRTNFHDKKFSAAYQKTADDIGVEKSTVTLAKIKTVLQKEHQNLFNFSAYKNDLTFTFQIEELATKVAKIKMIMNNKHQTDVLPIAIINFSIINLVSKVDIIASKIMTKEVVAAIQAQKPYDKKTSVDSYTLPALVDVTKDGNVFHISIVSNDSEDRNKIMGEISFRYQILMDKNLSLKLTNDVVYQIGLLSGFQTEDEEIAAWLTPDKIARVIKFRAPYSDQTVPSEWYGDNKNEFGIDNKLNVIGEWDFLIAVKLDQADDEAGEILYTIIFARARMKDYSSYFTKQLKLTGFLKS